MKTYVTFESIKPSSYYNQCYMCGNKRDLHECNNCLELFCTACDLLVYNWCNFCKYRRYRKDKKKDNTLRARQFWNTG
jgi:hypothetical protein